MDRAHGRCRRQRHPAHTHGGRKLNVERLEPRLLLAAAVSDDLFRELLSHGGSCRCPICAGMILESSLKAATVASASATWNPASTPLGVPQLSSRPGVKATLYLDFDGHVESRWGSFTNVVTPPYDTDGNYASFSAAEVSAIREIWARVAEDYAPFNLNVTTVAPPQIADRVAVRLAIGGHYSDWLGSVAGGVAYVGGFANGASNVGYVFAEALSNGNPRYTAEAVSHEAGHLLGLSHQAQWSGSQLVAEYNTGTSQWAPIMGVGYYAQRTTWTSGPTTAGASSRQDDLSILAGAANGFGYVADDYGDTISTAAALPISGTSVTLSGLIGRNDDRDVFRFNTGGGSLSVTLSTASLGANLDGVLELLSSTGKTIAAANPAGSFGASLATTVAAGIYYFVVRSSGGYGNLGQYTLLGTVPAAGTATSQAAPPPEQSAEGGMSNSSAPTGITSASGARIIDNGSAGFSASGLWQTAAGTGYGGDTRWASAGSGSAVATWTFTGLAPGQYRLAATWPGSQLHSASAPFSVYANNQLLRSVSVNQQRAAATFSDAGAKWQNLGTFTVQGNSLTIRLSSAATGRVVADAVRLERVYATSGGTTLDAATIAAEPVVAPLRIAPSKPSVPLRHAMPASSHQENPANWDFAPLLVRTTVTGLAGSGPIQRADGDLHEGLDADSADVLFAMPHLFDPLL